MKPKQTKYKARLDFFDYLVRFQEPTGGFFDTLTDLIEGDKANWLLTLKQRARKESRLLKASKVLRHLHRVQSIDIFKQVDLTPDWFGDNEPAMTKLKALHEQRECMIWYLLGKYRYYAFDVELFGWTAKRCSTYVRARRVYHKLLEVHKERVRQSKWDLKRAKVRSRRKKLIDKGLSPSEVTLYALRRGLGNAVPMPAPILEHPDTIWDS